MIFNHTAKFPKNINQDFAGMDESPDYTSTKLYNTVGMKLVDAVIKQNWKE